MSTRPNRRSLCTSVLERCFSSFSSCISFVGCKRVAHSIPEHRANPRKLFVVATNRLTRALTMSAMAVVMLTAAQAIADDAVSQSTMRKRQMIAQVVNCMKKRMSVDREISYNAASKVCKDQLNNQSNNSVSVALVASASPAKP
jgi:hypothetical protein